MKFLGIFLLKFEKRGEFPPDAPAMLDVALKDANDSWSELRLLVDEKKEEFIHAEMIQKFLLDGSETEAWIEEKAEIIDQTRDYGDSLSGVMALQRKLATMERDVNAIKSKISDLEAEAEEIKSKYPEDEDQLNETLDSVRNHFEKLENLLKLREEKLGQAGNLQTFMRDLAEFQVKYHSSFSLVHNSHDKCHVLFSTNENVVFGLSQALFRKSSSRILRKKVWEEPFLCECLAVTLSTHL